MWNILRTINNMLFILYNKYYIIVIGDSMKKGFTLVELIAVIAILSIILVIVMPNLLNNIKSKKNESSNLIRNIVKAAGRNYIIDHDMVYPTAVPITELCNGYIECPIKDSDNNEITGYVSVNENNIYSIVSNGETTLVINANGGETTQVLENPYTIWSKVTLERPTRDWYVFSGWTVIRGNGLINGDVVTVGDSETEVYATWEN